MHSWIWVSFSAGLCRDPLPFHPATLSDDYFFSPLLEKLSKENKKTKENRRNENSHSEIVDLVNKR